jgi:hypothetical protein
MYIPFDYTLTTPEARLAYITPYITPTASSKTLTQITNYILGNDHTLSYKPTNAISLDALEADIVESTPYTVPKPTLSDYDRAIPEIADETALAVHLETTQNRKLALSHRRTQYLIKDQRNPPIGTAPSVHTYIPATDGIDDFTTDYAVFPPLVAPINRDIPNKNGNCLSLFHTLDFTNPTHIYALFPYLAELAEFAVDHPLSNADDLLRHYTFFVAAADLPQTYTDILRLKQQLYTNTQIADHINETYHTNYSPQYISTIYKNTIPKLIAAAAADHLLRLQNADNPNAWKTCAVCGKRKLKQIDFTKNGNYRDGCLNKCKECARRS